MLTNRVLNMTPSATVELTAKVAELKRAGRDIIAFNVGEPDFDTPQFVKDAAVKALEEGFTKYTPVAGIQELREAVCEKLKKDNGVEYKPSQISVGTGAKQSLMNAILAICGEGDEVIIPTPCWVSYIEMVKLADATPVLVPTIEEEGFALDVSAIEKAVTKNTKAVLVNTPNNPTGAVYGSDVLRQVADLAVKNDFFILSDEVYEKLIYDGEEHTCIASFSEEVKEKTIIINGLSKAFAMTGWRIGYAAGPEKIIKAINGLQGHMTSNTNSIAQKAAAAALRGPQDAVEEMRQEFAKRRQTIVNMLSEMDGIQCAEPKGAFYVMPNVAAYFGKRAGDAVIKDSFDLAGYLLEEAGIALVPGGAFESPNNIRISYSNSMDNIVEGMKRMKAALEKLV